MKPDGPIFVCPKCSFEQYGYNESWHEYVGFPLICQKCGEMFWVKMINEAIIPKEKVKEKIPPLKIGSKVYLNNKEHKLHLSPGMVIDKDHIHYRVKLRWHDGQKTRRTVLWVPEHWIKCMPSWL